MKKTETICFTIIIMLMGLFAGCTTKPRVDEIKDIPSNAEKVLSLDLTSESGTFSNGKIEVSGNGYIIIDTKNISGTLKAIEVIDQSRSDIIYTISNPEQALYDSSYYDYSIDGDYVLRFVDAKYIEGTIAVYFVENVSSTPGSPDVSADGTPKVVHEDKSVKIIRSMMELNYASMTVDEFNESIQTLCADADTTVFEVISDAYDHFAVYNESGEFMYTMFSDTNLETFMQTTLSYSAQEIFGEPVHLGNITYMTMPNMTAMEVSQKREQMKPDEWERYFEENIADISIFPVLSYEIEANIQDSGAIMVSERDSKINNIHSAIKEFLLGMDAETATVMAETLRDDILVEFQRLSIMYSDDKMMIECRVQSIERDILSHI